MTPNEEAALVAACRRVRQMRSVAVVLAKYSNDLDVGNALHSVAFDLSGIAIDIDAILDGKLPSDPA